MREEVRALRRTIYMLVLAAGGRAEISFADMERAHSNVATIACHYDHERNRQVWTIQQPAPGKSVAIK